MKRTLCISSLILLALAACARNPAAPPPAGGQSGDDGDVTADPPPGPQPGIPQLPCDEEATELGLDAPTAFGKSARELLNGVAPAADSPLFWVAFDALPDSTSFVPGPSQTSLALRLEARAGESAKQSLWRPLAGAAGCPGESLAVPVRVTVQSSDGALDESVDAELAFSSATTAQLHAELPLSALAGTFAFTAIGAPNLEARRLSVFADFWPGGSRGQIVPSFASAATPGGEPAPGTTPATPPPPATTPSPPASGASVAVPAVPAHWSAVAVWPRREVCEGDGRGAAAAYATDERLIGVSIADISDVLAANASWTLASGDGTTAVRFNVDAPSGLQCVRHEGRSIVFDVRGTLRGETGTGDPLEALSAASVFELSATSALDGALAELRWVRRDVHAPETRGAFEAARGVTLAAAEQYQQVWWSWHGVDVRSSATAAWEPRAELVVSSLNSEQAAEAARIRSLGGPGVGVSFDEETRFPVLPGDALLEAELVP